MYTQAAQLTRYLLVIAKFLVQDNISSLLVGKLDYVYDTVSQAAQ